MSTKFLSFRIGKFLLMLCSVCSACKSLLDRQFITNSFLNVMIFLTWIISTRFTPCGSRTWSKCTGYFFVVVYFKSFIIRLIHDKLQIIYFLQKTAYSCAERNDEYGVYISFWVTHNSPICVSTRACDTNITEIQN